MTERLQEILENVNPKMKRALLTAIITSLVMALVLTCGFTTFVRGKGFLAAPADLFKIIRNEGFPFGMFFVAFIGLAFLFIRTILKSVDGGADPLGRKITYTKDRQPYGDAHFEKPGEYEEDASVDKVEDAQGIILGMIEDPKKLKGKKAKNAHVINSILDGAFRLNRHMMVFGASGTGKSFTFSKTYCYQIAKRRESIVIADPDGGLYRDMAGYYMDQGYVVRRYDLATMDKSDGWNCLTALKSGNVEVDVRMISAAIIRNVAAGSGEVYVTASEALLSALLLYVMLSDEYEGNRTLTAAYQMLKHPEGEKYLDTKFAAASLSEKTRPAQEAYLDYRKGSDNLRGNIQTNLSIYLQLLGTTQVKRILETDDIDVVLPGTQPCAYFCIFPDSHSTFKFLVTLFFTVMFIAQTNHADIVCDGPLPVAVNYLLDEFPSLGVFPDWEKRMATIRKRNMHVAMICQGVTQLKTNYPYTWETTLSNCATALCLGVNDESTARMLSTRIGDASVEVRTDQHPAVGGLLAAPGGYSTGTGKTSLLSINQLYRQKRGDMIIILQHHDPIHAYAFPHNLHPESKKCREILRRTIPSIDDVDARKAWRDAERQRIAEWNIKHGSAEEADNTENFIVFSEDDFVIDGSGVVLDDDGGIMDDLFGEDDAEIEASAPERTQQQTRVESIWASADEELDPADQGTPLTAAQMNAHNPKRDSGTTLQEGNFRQTGAKKKQSRINTEDSNPDSDANKRTAGLNALP